MLDVLRRIEARLFGRPPGSGHLLPGLPFRHRLCDQDPPAPFVGVLLPPPQKHYASIIDSKRVAQLLIEGESDLEADKWRIPDKRNEDTHIVPLSRQGIEILKEVKLITGNGKYVFPAMTSSQRPMSENTVNTALRRIGTPRKK